MIRRKWWPDFVILTRIDRSEKYDVTSHPEHGSKKRSYKNISRESSGKRQKSIMIKTWKQDMEAMLSKTDTQISEIPYYFTYRCFSTAEKKELRRKMRVIITATNKTRRAFPGILYLAYPGGRLNMMAASCDPTSFLNHLDSVATFRHRLRRICFREQRRKLKCQPFVPNHKEVHITIQ